MMEGCAVVFHPDFKKAIAVAKGVRTFAVCFAAICVAVVGYAETVSLPSDVDLGSVGGIVTAASLIMGLVRVVENVRKNGNGPGTPGPMWNWSDPIAWVRGLFAGAATVFLIGCAMSGCAINSVKFVDGVDGSSVTTTDLVPIFMKRDLAAQSAKYSWTEKGGGNWNIGASAHGTSGTEALQAITSIVDLARMLQGALGSGGGESTTKSTKDTKEGESNIPINPHSKGDFGALTLKGEPPP